jgi:hypothetical protein
VPAEEAWRNDPELKLRDPDGFRPSSLVASGELHRHASAPARFALANPYQKNRPAFPEESRPEVSRCHNTQN